MRSRSSVRGGGWRMGRLTPLALASAAVWISAGCAVFPQGAYWPEPHTLAARLHRAEAGAAAAPSPAGFAAPPRADLVAAVTRRWADDGLADSARRMNGWAGRSAYADAVRIVAWCYVEKVSYRDLVVAGLESLRAALESPQFRRRFEAARDDQRRARFAEALDILTLKARAADLWFAFQAGDWLAVAMEKNRALLGLPDGAVVAEFLFGAMDRLDPYTRFLTADMLRDYEEQEAGRYTGIGVALEVRDGRVFVARAMEGGPAAEAGLAAGDEIVAVDGESATALGPAEVVRRLRGESGSAVTLSVLSPGAEEPRSIVLLRRRIVLPAVRDVQVLDPERGVGYLALTDFRGGSAGDLRRAIGGLQKQGIRALILDLRDNPGGLLLAAVETCGVFLDGGEVGNTRGRMLGATWTYSVPWPDRPAWRGPLAVLVNGGTASAAEVVASALARRGRATLVGETTFGKGAVQIRLPVDWGRCAVSVTIARVYDVEGEGLNGLGVSPAVEVPGRGGEAASLRDDAVVRAALEALEALAPEADGP